MVLALQLVDRVTTDVSLVLQLVDRVASDVDSRIFRLVNSFPGLDFSD